MSHDANQCDQILEKKVAQYFFPKVAQKVAYAVRFFKISQKVANHLGFFLNKFICQDFSKVAQSGHTASCNIQS